MGDKRGFGEGHQESERGAGAKRESGERKSKLS
jgi:hypothetical protein